MRKFKIVLLIAAVGGLFLLINHFSAPKNNPSKSAVKSAKYKSSNEEKESPLEALEGLQWMNRARAYPGADIPANAYISAMQQFNARFGNQNSTAVGSWTSIGPNNIGGRSLCLAIDPLDTNKIWMGSAGGGLWKSTVGGMGVNAWTYVPTGFPVIGVSTIAINPANPLEMYIGTGETYNLGTFGVGLTDRTTRGSYGMGILKSTDGGITWTQALNWAYQQQDCIWEIEINPLRPNTVFAATTQGVYKSTDAGANWSQVLNVPMCMDLALLSNDTTVIMCGAGNLNSANKGLYRSSNGGLNWSIVTGIPNPSHTGRTTISLYPNNNDIAIAQVCDLYNTIGFYKTTDRGVTWALTSATDVCGYQGWYCKGMAFRPGNANEFLAGGINMFRSSDGGINFYQVSDMSWGPQFMHSDVHDIVVNPQNPYSVFVITDGGLFRTWDFGDSYTECTDGYVTSQCYIGSVSQTNPDFALTGLQDNYSIEYNGTPYWTPVVGGDGCYNAIDPIDDYVSFVAYQYLNVFQSVDQGLSYYQVNYNPSSAQGGNPTAFLAPYIICPSNTAVIYAGGTGFIRSDDQGMTWPTVSADPIDNDNYVLSIGVSSTEEDSVYMATAPDLSPMKFMLSVNGGYNFVDRSAGLPNRYPRRIAVDPRNSKIVYVVFAGFGTGHVFKSINAGVTWTDISTTLPDVPFHCIMMDPQYPDVVYAGSDMGLYVSLDGGATWTTHNTGIPDWTMVYDLVPCAADRSLMCCTHGHGVWRRSLNDVISDVQNPPKATPFSISVFPNPSTDNVTITFGELYEDAQLRIVDLNGKIVHEEMIPVGRTSAYLQIKTESWANGVYLVNMTSGKTVATKRLVITH